MTAMLFFQYALMFFLVGVDALMFWVLVDGLWATPGEQQIDPAISALVGGMVGAITAAIGMGSRDLFDTSDNRNGQPKP